MGVSQQFPDFKLKVICTGDPNSGGGTAGLPYEFLYRIDTQQLFYLPQGAGPTGWVLFAGGMCGVADQGFIFVEDFLDALTSSYTVGGTGSNSVGGNQVTANNPGVVRQSVAAVGDRAVITNGPNCLLLGGGEVTIQALVKVNALQDAVDRWSYRNGMGDLTTAADAIDGVYFEHDLAVNGNNNWWAATASNSVRTRQDTGVGVNAGTFDKLKIVINPLATQADFYVSGILRTSIVTNIPSGASRQTGTEWIQLVKTLGANPGIVDCDYYKIMQKLTTER